MRRLVVLFAAGSCSIAIGLAPVSERASATRASSGVSEAMRVDAARFAAAIGVTIPQARDYLARQPLKGELEGALAARGPSRFAGMYVSITPRTGSSS